MRWLQPRELLEAHTVVVRRVISSQADQEWSEGSETRAWSPDRTVKPHECAATSSEAEDIVPHSLETERSQDKEPGYKRCRWVAAPGEEPSTIGNTASLGEVSLSAFTGGTAGLTGAHVIYEPA